MIPDLYVIFQSVFETGKGRCVCTVFLRTVSCKPVCFLLSNLSIKLIWCGWETHSAHNEFNGQFLNKKKKVIHPKKPKKQSIIFLVIPLSMLSSKLCQQRASVLFCCIYSPKSTRSFVTIAGVLVLLIKNEADHRGRRIFSGSCVKSLEVLNNRACCTDTREIISLRKHGTECQ